MKNTSPTLPEVLCILLFLTFVCVLGYMAFSASRKSSPASRTTMETVGGTTSMQTIRFEACPSKSSPAKNSASSL
jgi:hypothetical protein